MEVAPEAQGLGDASVSSSLTGVGFRGSSSVSWLHYLPQTEGPKYLMTTAVSPASPLSQSGLLG